MRRRTPRSTRTDTLCPYTTLCRAERLAAAGHGPAGFGWHVEADQRRVGVDDGQRGVAVAVGFGQALDLVVEHIGQALDEQQRQQVVLELGRILFAADLAGGVSTEERRGGKECVST